MLKLDALAWPAHRHKAFCDDGRDELNVGLVLKEFHNWIFMIRGSGRGMQPQRQPAQCLMSRPDLTPSVFSWPGPCSHP